MTQTLLTIFIPTLMVLVGILSDRQCWARIDASISSLENRLDARITGFEVRLDDWKLKAYPAAKAEF